MHRPRPALAFVFFTILLDVLGFGLLIPVAPKLVAIVRGLPPTGAEHDASLPVVLMLAIATFILNVAQFGLHMTWVLSMQKRFAWSPWDVGMSLFVVGISSAIVQGGLARKIIPALGERACLVGGMVLACFAFVGYGLAWEGWQIYTIIAVASIGGVAGPAAQAINSKAVPANEQGLLQGAMGSLTSIAGVLGPLMAGGVFYMFTPKVGPAVYPGAGSPFLLGAALCMLSLVPVMSVWGRMPRNVAAKPDERMEAAG